MGDSVGIALGHGDGIFSSGVYYNSGISMYPNSVASGDFNQDGKSDIVFSDYFGHNIAVMLGGWQSAVQYSNGCTGTSSSVVTDDFNRDARLDLAVANPDDHKVGILLGQGDGTFSAATTYLAGSNPYRLATADFDGDGKPDIAAANWGDGVNILRGNGDGSFLAAVSMATPDCSNAIARGDFDRDNNVDLVIAACNESLDVLIGNGDGTFGAPVYYALDTVPVAVTTGDFNNDGNIDIVTGTSQLGVGHSVAVLLGNGDGTFQAATALYDDTDPASVSAADVNRDGRLDIVVGSSNEWRVSVILNGGCL